MRASNPPSLMHGESSGSTQEQLRHDKSGVVVAHTHRTHSAVRQWAALDEHEVLVWWVNLDRVASSTEEWLGLLSVGEHVRAQRFHFQPDRQRFIVARGLLRTLLSHYVGLPPAALEFSYGIHGKPALAPTSGGQSIRFNVSHAGGSALYAVTRGREVGIDLERVRADRLSSRGAKRVLSPNEQIELGTLPVARQPAAWFRYWTRKEAYVKARGIGLFHPLHQIDTSSGSNGMLSIAAAPDQQAPTSRWTIVDFDLGAEYVAALAMEGSLTTVRLFTDSLSSPENS